MGLRGDRHSSRHRPFLVMGLCTVGIKVALEHRTSYTFDRLVEVHPTSSGCGRRRTLVRPSRPTPWDVEPADHFINWQQDAFGNFLARLVFPNPTRSLTITVGLIADLEGHQPVRLLHRGVRRDRSVRLPGEPACRIWTVIYVRSMMPARARTPLTWVRTWVRDHPLTPGCGPSTSSSNSTVRSTPT